MELIFSKREKKHFVAATVCKCVVNIKRVLKHFCTVYLTLNPKPIYCYALI